MKRPWQIWSAYVAALVVAAGAVGWVTVRAGKADRAEAEARAQAAVEEDIRLALWRMDSLMVSFLAQESARPHDAYQSVSVSPRSALRSPRSPETARVLASPLLTDPPPEVRVYFDIDPSGKLSSPQVPSAQERRLVNSAKVSPERLAASEAQLNELQKLLGSEPLVARLPAPPAIENNSNSIVLLEQQIGSQLVQTEGNTRRLAQRTQQQEQASRAANEYQARANYITNNGLLQMTNSINANWDLGAENVRIAPLRAVVVRGELLLARQAVINGQTHVQGCWLDWNTVRTALLGSVGDLLPQASLELLRTVPENGEARMMASLPVRLSLTADPEADIGGLSPPVRLSLIVAWGAMALAALAVAALLHGVVSLSERRADFVSAVTHELRTPLTTFRMYAEMLAEGMVGDETARRGYLDTLRTEADRLTHLVENVLAYARLERGGLGDRIRRVTGGKLIDLVVARSGERARQAGLELCVEASDAARAATALADPSAVEQIAFNLVDNASKYAATAADRRIHLEASLATDRLILRVRDHGPGLSLEQRKRLFEPFRKSASDAANSAPGVGLGLALSRRLARDMGGDLQWDATVTDGAAFAIVLRSVS